MIKQVMEQHDRKKSDVIRWFLVFLAFGFVGWVYEVCIVWFEMHLGFENRGFLLGPCLPIYGVGGLLILVVTVKVRKHPILCFLVVCLFATSLELLASYLMEWWMGSFLWDYRNTGYGPTFEGRIALRSSLQFGLMGMAAVYVVYPLMNKVVEKVREKLPRCYLVMTLMLLATFLADLVYHLIHGSNAKW
ncbi:MAG: putative ABC transporter permease [Lachnospiraceae bacterium]|nr:putative ABC transporter permease [Lachnospiraceae bacterium]MBR3508570.1 putative ABC transporter permease [Lachnospiraceae bacterium]MBR4608324.1 putative ABC transporter permease [Lachnospiraceae bacterium]MBR6152598.1 putative ABC transporter permease [Lachnospiraceae bacterium]